MDDGSIRFQFIAPQCNSVGSRADQTFVRRATKVGLTHFEVLYTLTGLGW
jgi:hypothetical protein